MMKRGEARTFTPASLLLFVAALTLGVSTAAAQQANVDCAARSELPTLIDQARELSSSGRHEEALTLLKSAKDCSSQDVRWVLAMSMAYESAGNMAWAARILAEYSQNHREDCLVVARQARVQLNDANYRGALLTIENSQCKASVEDAARLSLLASEAWVQAGEPDQARQAFSQAAASVSLYEPDWSRFVRLESQLWPLKDKAFAGRIEIGSGYTSNALLGSPMDPQAGTDDFGSVESELTLRVRGASPNYGIFRVFIEGESKAKILYSDAASNLSNMDLGVLPGLEFAWPEVDLQVYYRLDAIWLAGAGPDADGPYYVGHRGEALVQTGLGLYVLAGGGRREFSNMGRTRTEMDLGLGWGGRLWSPLYFLAGASARRHSATNPAYNLYGATFILSTRWQLPGGWSVRLGGSTAWDSYPESAGEEAFHSVEAREDITLKGRVGLQSPQLAPGFSLLLMYEPSWRFSTASLYEFSDHSVSLQAVFSFGSQPWGPGLSEVDDYLAIEPGQGFASEEAEERLQDLLKGDQESQRGSSCLN